MEIIILKPKREFKVPIFAECITPDILAGKTLSEIEKLPVIEGGKETNLCELFQIEGKTGSSPNDTKIKLVGDFSKVRCIGSEMTDGEIIVEGNAGLRLGEKMRGGRITVHGNAGSWLGTMMVNGEIEVFGDAGHYIGSSYRGAREGMRSGTIKVHGSAGSEIGNFMRGGTIIIDGCVDIFAGIHMQGGEILIRGDSAGRIGAFMRGGKIVLCGYTPSVLPSFTIEELRPKVKIAGERIEETFYLFIGDHADEGNGKLFISKDRNPHLKHYERFL